jgi:nucleoid DNA-binding protein
MPFLGTHKKKYSENNIIGKITFVRLVSDEAGLSLRDAKKFWSAVEVVVPRILEQGMELNLGSFGKFYVTDFSSKHGLEENKTGKLYKRKRIGFKPSKVLKRVSKQ